ncbi:uncharacterized protein LOC143857209 isoform X2 [Tasmannia lanceolata]|uniref:uncharacterized protein LOC143857209 isoform X2 n=1 Tax=Tasmannia lanceolata TaxID=3420 RepID=UPI004062B589
MGTKVQSKNYFPGYYFMGDLNEDANTGNWSLLCEDKMFKTSQYYNGFTQRPVDGYLDHDKELLKQTMIQHEAVFRKQVYELHRLYRIQRDLMKDLQKKELHTYSTSAVTSQANPFSSQVPYEDTQKKWKMPAFSMVNSNCYVPSISSTDNIQSPLNLLKESIVQAGSSPLQNGSSVNDCDVSESKPRKFPRRTFDLQLPADEYIDSEEEKVGDVSLEATYSCNKNCGIEPDCNVKLTLGTGGNPSTSGDGWKSGSHFRNGLNTHYLADLNEPTCGNEGASASASINFVGPVASHGATQGQRSVKSNLSTLGSPRDFFQDNQKGRDHRTFSSLLHAENEGTRCERLCFNLEPGKTSSNTNPFTPVFCHEKSTTSSELTQLGLKNAHELPPFLRSDQSKKEAHLREKTICGVEISKRNYSLTVSNYSGLSAPPIAVQALPCFNGSAGLNTRSKSSNSSIQSPGVSKEKWIKSPDVTGGNWYLNGNHRSQPSCESEASYQNGFHSPFGSETNSSVLHSPLVKFNKLNHANGSNNLAYEHIEDRGSRKYLKDLDCRDVKSVKDMNLNLCLPNGFGDRISQQQDLMFIDGEEEHGDPLGGMSWLKTKLPPENTISIRGGTTQMDLNQCVFSSPSMSCRDQSEINDTGNGVKDGLLNVDLSCDITLPESEKQFCADNPTVKMGIDDSPKGFNYAINLNSEIEARKEKPKSLEILYTTNADIPKKNTIEIDLEAPISPEVVEDIVDGIKSPRTDQVVALVQLAEREREDPQATLAKMAAEAIITMSSSVSNHLDNTSCPSPIALRDSLIWFSEVVSSNAIDLENTLEVSREKSGADQEYSDDEFDFFEAMTLKLSETKLEDCCKPWEQENQKVEETGTTPLLTRPRRGQARRGRQRRDFQKDILPGLTSLSRHEVTEDLQTFGGLMRASGCFWQSGLARRNAARNGWHTRGRGRSRGSATAWAGSFVDPPPTHPSNSDVELERISLQGWGKTIRRRRQRFPTGNAAALLT